MKVLIGKIKTVFFELGDLCNNKVFLHLFFLHIEYVNTAYVCSAVELMLWLPFYL